MLRHLIFTAHAQQRLAEYDVREEDVQHVLLQGDIIRTYPEDRPLESHLVLGYVNDRPLHIVAADDTPRDSTIVITVYEPAPDLWRDDFKTKK